METRLSERRAWHVFCFVLVFIVFLVRRPCTLQAQEDGVSSGVVMTTVPRYNGEKRYLPRRRSMRW